MHEHPSVRIPEKWEQSKLKVIEAFQRLAKEFGYMRVCKQMIGADSNGNPKVWINPDPVAHRPWAPCDDENAMVTDITLVF